MRGVKLAQDLIDAKTGEAVAEAGQKITPRLAKKLVEGGLKNVFVTNEQLVGSYISTDFINEETGEVIAEAGDELSETLLKTLAEAGAKEVSILAIRSEEHTSELQSLMRTSYAGLCLKTKK